MAAVNIFTARRLTKDFTQAARMPIVRRKGCGVRGIDGSTILVSRGISDWLAAKHEPVGHPDSFEGHPNPFGWPFECLAISGKEQA